MGVRVFRACRSPSVSGMRNDDAITQVDAQEALTDWRVVAGRAQLTVDCGGFARAAGFVTEVAALAEDADHHPEIDLRFARVHLALSSHDVGALSRRDVALGRRIADLARSRGHRLETVALAHTQIAIDVRDPAAVLPFWKAAYAYDQTSDVDLVDPERRGPSIWLQHTDDPGSGTTGRNRVHIDIYVPHDLVAARLDAVLAAGGRLVSDAYAPSWWVLADPEGNEACLCTWQDHD